MKTIIICGGKTLGHVTPGISVIHELHKKYPMLRIIYITCDNQKELKIIKCAPIDKVIYFNLTFKRRRRGNFSSCSCRQHGIGHFCC